MRILIDQTILGRWKALFETTFKGAVETLASSYPDKKSLILDYWELDKADSELADLLMKQPVKAFVHAEKALSEIDTASGIKLSDVHVRIRNLPQKTPLSRITVKNIGIFSSIEGLVKRVTEPKPLIKEAVFECVRCGASLRIEQLEEIIKEPSECYESQGGCGRKSSFRLNKSQSLMRDIQKAEIQEFIENTQGKQPEKMTLFLEDDLIRSIYPGDEAVINGYIQITERRKGMEKSTMFNKIFIVNDIERKETKYEDVVLSENDIGKIQDASKDPLLFDKLVQSIAPSIHGYLIEKTALLLQMVGGVAKELDDNIRIKGDINILLVGDPGTAKSQLLTFISKTTPRSVFCDGKGASAAGLTASVVRDDFGEGQWSLEAGALVLADGGIAIVDELEKMSEEDRNALHTALEQQCYDEKTEVLTERGWKYFKDVTKNDKIATLTKEHNLEYAFPTNKYSYRYRGKMYSVKSQQVDLLVTPNHKVLVKRSKGGGRWTEFGLYAVSDVVSKSIKFKKNCKWRGMDKKIFYLPSVIKKKNQNHAGEATGKKKIKMDDWLELLGYYLSEGSLRYVNNLPYTTSIAQFSDKIKIEKILKCINKCGFEYRNNKGHIDIFGKQLATYLSKFGFSREKYVPKYVKELSKRQIRIFLDALICGDGHISKENGHESYFSISRKLIDDVQELVLKTGESANIVRIIPPTKRMFPNGRVYNTRTSYVLSFIKQRNTPHVNNNQQKQITEKNYDGMIYCLELPNHVMYVRRNGKPVWCGNSIHINKAGINATLKTRCALLAAANPKEGRFDEFSPVAEQIDLPITLLSRFDLIFPIFDRPDKEIDAEIAEHIGRVHKKKTKEAYFKPDDIKKYVSYARRIKPVLEDSAILKINQYYLDKRWKSNENIAITPRQLEALYRLSEASAKLRLSEKVEDGDAERAIEIFEEYMQRIGIDRETGKYDIDTIVIGKSASQRTRMHTLKNIIISLCKEYGDASMEEIVIEAQKFGIAPEKAEADVEKLKYDGQIYEPKNGRYRLSGK